MSVQQQSRTPDEVRLRLSQQLQHVIINFDRQHPPGELLQTLILLESLPLSTDEFGVARNRINNALRYVEATEFGAARYELRILLAWLREDAARQAAAEQRSKRPLFRRRA